MSSIQRTIKSKKIDIVFLVLLLSVFIWMVMHFMMDFQRESLLPLTIIIIPVLSTIFLIKSIIMRSNIDGFGWCIWSVTFLIKNEIDYVLYKKVTVNPLIVIISNAFIKWLFPVLFLIALFMFFKTKGLKGLKPEDSWVVVYTFLYVLMLVRIFI